MARLHDLQLLKSPGKGKIFIFLQLCCPTINYRGFCQSLCTLINTAGYGIDLIRRSRSFQTDLELSIDVQAKH